MLILAFPEPILTKMTLTIMTAQAPEWKNLNLKEMSLEEMRAAIPTGISVIKTDEESNIYYDLRGQRVKTPTKGIYIRNGKKEVIR